MIAGITGSFGSGKSTVRRLFGARSFTVIDADEICHRCYTPRYPQVLEALLRRWGKAVFTADGQVDRSAVALRVFRDAGEREFLEELLDRPIREALQKAVSECRGNAVVEVPLLFEKGYEALFSRTVAVYASGPVRMRRVALRGVSPEEFRRRDALQWPGEKKLERADYGLINNADEITLERQVDALIGQWA